MKRKCWQQRLKHTHSIITQMIVIRSLSIWFCSHVSPFWLQEQEDYQVCNAHPNCMDVWLCLGSSTENLEVGYFPFPISGSLRQTELDCKIFPPMAPNLSILFWTQRLLSFYSYWAVAGQQLVLVTPFKNQSNPDQLRSLIYSCLHCTRPWFNAHTQTLLPSTPLTWWRDSTLWPLIFISVTCTTDSDSWFIATKEKEEVRSIADLRFCRLQKFRPHSSSAGLYV